MGSEQPGAAIRSRPDMGSHRDMVMTGRPSALRFQLHGRPPGEGAASNTVGPMSGSAVSIAKLIAEGKGLSELVEPEVPSRMELPATTATKDNVASVQGLAY